MAVCHPEFLKTLINRGVRHGNSGVGHEELETRGATSEEMAPHDIATVRCGPQESLLTSIEACQKFKYHCESNSLNQ